MSSASMSYRAQVARLLRIGIPLVLANLAGFAMHVTDTLMLGWYDLTALAAVTVASSTFFIFNMLGMGFAIAVTPLVAEAEAQGDITQSRRAVRMALWLSAIYAVAFVPLAWFSEPIFRLLGQEPQIAAYAQDYTRIVGFSMLPALVIAVGRNFLAALEHTKVILVVTLGLVLLNIPVNWILIFGNLGAPEMGIAGAATATLVMNLIGLVALVVYMARVFPEHQMFRRLWVADWPAFGRVFRLGLPIGLTNIAEGGLFTASAIMMGWIGEVPLAAHGIALQLSALTFMGHLGISQAVTVRAGQAFGRRDEPMLRQVAWASLGVAAVWVAVTLVLFLGVPEFLIQLFLSPNEPEKDAVIAIGVHLMAMAALFQLVDAGQVMMVSLLRGLQDTAVPMWLAIGSYWGLGVPFAYLMAFPLGFGPIGLWAGLCLGLACACLSLGWRFWGRSVRIGAP